MHHLCQPTRRAPCFALATRAFLRLQLLRCAFSPRSCRARALSPPVASSSKSLMAHCDFLCFCFVSRCVGFVLSIETETDAQNSGASLSLSLSLHPTLFFIFCLPRLCASVRWEVNGAVVGSGAAVTTTFDGTLGEYKASCETHYLAHKRARWRKIYAIGNVYRTPRLS